jgi:hypothetical protein
MPALEMTLRQEVESLFAYQAKAGDFIETPRYDIRLAGALRELRAAIGCQPVRPDASSGATIGGPDRRRRHGPIYRGVDHA